MSGTKQIRRQTPKQTIIVAFIAKVWANLQYFIT